MDLLGSILGVMDKPPTRDKKDKDIYDKQKKQYENIKNLERDKLNRFRNYVEERLGKLVKDDNRKFMEFQPLDQVYRSIVHDVAETAGLAGISFGIEGTDRYIVVYKKEHLPSEDELNARRNGVPWNKQTAEQYAEQRHAQQLEQEKSLSDSCKRRREGADESTQSSSYKDKYIHLIGQDVNAINDAYGCVPSQNKKDVRSIEQTMADIQAKKKLKSQHTTSAAELTKDDEANK